MKPLVDVLNASTEFLRGRGVPSPRLEVELLLAHALGLTRVQVYLQFDRPLHTEELDTIRALVKRRGNRECLAHIVGHKEFFGREFRVRPGVLVPRPDTETLIETMLSAISADTACFVADVGSGSGCIGLTLALERPLVRVYAVDASEPALAITRENVALLGLLDRVAVLRGNWLDPVPPARAIDWVVANPPYIPSRQIDDLEPEVREHEPRLALDGGDDGLSAYRILVPVAAKRARVGVAVEVGQGQAPAVVALFSAAGLVGVTTTNDLAGTPRVVLGRRPSAVKTGNAPTSAA